MIVKKAHESMSKPMSTKNDKDINKETAVNDVGSNNPEAIANDKTEEETVISNTEENEPASKGAK